MNDIPGSHGLIRELSFIDHAHHSRGRRFNYQATIFTKHNSVKAQDT